MTTDIRIASKGVAETLRDRIAELEELEAAGLATPDACEELVDLYAFLDKLYEISLKPASKHLGSGGTGIVATELGAEEDFKARVTGMMRG